MGRELRKPRFVGDMPHGWVASDFMRAALDLFAYEREADRALVLAAGLPPQWLEGEGVAVENLRTPYGRLSYAIQNHIIARLGKIKHISKDIDSEGQVLSDPTG